MEQKNLLREETINFAIEISDICDNIKGCSVYINQILRCSSSIGANVHEAKYAQSKADFINKLEIALKEASETEYWLELLFRKKAISAEDSLRLKNTCGKIRRRLIASITIDLPAPVSPVLSLKPSVNSISDRSITAIFSICKYFNINKPP